MVLTTSKKAVVLAIHANQLEVITQIDLPKSVDYRTADAETLKEITLARTHPKTLDLLEPPMPVTEGAMNI